MNALDDNRGDWTSASNAEADRLCPGRHKAQQGLPELPKTPESTTGERIHAIWCGLGVPDATPEELDAADSLFDQERDLAEKYFGVAEAHETVRATEQRLWHEFRTRRHFGPLKTSGRFDVLRIHPKQGRCLLLDGKTGWLEVADNPRNLQLRRLAALAYASPNIGLVGEVAVAIIRPNSKPPSALCVYSEDDLQNSVEEMERDVSASHDPNAKRVPGEEQCTYCRAQNLCEQHLKWLAAALPADGPPILLPMLPSVREWTPQQRSLFLEREGAARKWLEDRKEEIKALLAEDPSAAPGYTLAPGDERETITDLQEVFNRFVLAGGKTEQFLKAVKGVKKNLTEQVREVTGLKGKGLTQKVKELIEGCTETKQSAPTIEKAKALQNAA